MRVIEQYNFQMKENLSLPYQQYQRNGKSLQGLRLNNQYEVKSLIGQGQYAKVFKALDLKKRQVVAIKLLDIKKLEQSKKSEDKKALERRYIMQEDIIMKKFSHHPNILTCIDSYANQDLKIIITPFCEDGTLHQQLLKAGGSFDEQMAIQIMKQLAHAIAELHMQKVIHRDLKPQNIFRKNGYYLIGDFGLSKVLDEKAQNNTLVGSYNTRAPEVKTRKYNFKADIYSLGVIFYLMVCEGDMEKKFKQLSGCVKSGFQNIPNISDFSIDFLKRTIVDDPLHRMGWKQMKYHPIFSKEVRQNSCKILSTCFIIPSSNEFYFLDEQLENYEGKNEVQSFCSSSVFLNILKESTTTISLIPSIQSNSSDNTAQFYHQIRQKQMNHIHAKEEETRVFEKFKELYLGVMVAKYISDEIIIPIEENQLLDMKEKKNIELMYLLSMRCFLNMSNLKDHMEENNSQKLNDLFNKFPRTECQIFYGVCDQTFHKYCKMLTKEESKIVETVKSLIRSSEKNQKYNKYFTGLENLDFSKQEQIELTVNYMKNIEKFLTRNDKLNDIMMIKLRKYKDINLIGVDELQTIGFIRAVNSRLKSYF